MGYACRSERRFSDSLLILILSPTESCFRLACWDQGLGPKQAGAYVFRGTDELEMGSNRNKGSYTYYFLETQTDGESFLTSPLQVWPFPARLRAWPFSPCLPYRKVLSYSYSLWPLSTIHRENH